MHVFNVDEIFLIAEKIERNGEEFYAEAARIVDDPEGKAVLQKLSAMESQHVVDFSRLREALPDDLKMDPDWGPLNELLAALHAVADRHVINRHANVAEMIGSRRTARELLDMALVFEKDSIALFERMRAAVPEGWGREKVDQLIGEEERHVRFIEEALTRLAQRGM
jgi:rubrerythrin